MASSSDTTQFYILNQRRPEVVAQQIDTIITEHAAELEKIAVEVEQIIHKSKRTSTDSTQQKES